jgi:CCR4-NOT transcription complex subunit 1
LIYYCLHAFSDTTPHDTSLTIIPPHTIINILTRYRYHGQDLRRQQRTLDGQGSLLSLDSFNQVLSVLREFPNQVLKEEILELAMFAQRAANSGGIQGAAAAKLFSPANTQQQQAANGADADKLDITQQESDAHFMKMYQGHVTVEETVALLSRYKGSQNQKEQEVFRCMLHNLLDEYRFYENYPDRELTLTAHLFGLLIKNQLISSITLGIALRYVLEALRKAPLERGRAHRMFLFGKTTIEEFRARLSEWPQYCAHLLQVPHLGALAPQLKEDAEVAISNPAALSGLVRRTAPHERSSIITATAAATATATNPPQSSNAEATSLNSTNPLSLMPKGDSGLGDGAGAAADCSLSAAMGVMSLNMDPMLPSVLPLCFNPRVDPMPLHNLLGEKKQALPTLTRMGGIEEMARVNVDPAAKAVAPPTAKVDPMVMIINNIGMNNYEAKSIELKGMLHRDHYLWFANFMVSKRISAQPNLHGLYLAVLDIVGFGTNELYAAVLEATYVLCSMFFLPFLVCDVSVSLLSVYCCLLAFSDITWHESNHHPTPPPQSINRHNTHSLITMQVLSNHPPPTEP